MQTAGPLIWTTQSLFGAFSAGTIAVVGRAIGARNTQAANAAARASVLLAALLGLVVTVGSLLALDSVTTLLGGSDPLVRAEAQSYLRVALPAMPAFLIALAAVSSMQAAGDTRRPLMIGVLGNVVHLALNAVLIFGVSPLHIPRMGAAGAGWSTAFSGVLEAVLALYALRSSTSAVTLRVQDKRDVREAARRVLNVSSGALVEVVLYHTGYLLFVRSITSLGDAAMAANQALISIESISFLTAEGWAVAAGASVAQALGASSPASAKRAGWIASVLCGGLLGVVAIVFAVIPETLVGWFRNEPEIITQGARALRVGALAQVPMAIGIVLGQSMRGAGATREALVISFAGALVLRLVATWFFTSHLHLGLMGVWLGSSVDWTARSIAYVVRWKQGAWSRAKV